MKLSSVAAALLAAVGLSGQAKPPKYVEGQVWEYRTRPQDAGSLLKVQRVGMMGAKKVYHISIVGVHFATPGISGILPHIPVSDETLDASVTKLSAETRDFPTSALDEGIEEWRKAQGGVFTIPISQIVDIIDEKTATTQMQAPAEPLGSR
ncbi:hypothetical protein [uncultured Sphingomonas sp.]|uniref:hypothetical protein n=1 Tax=uncultured Sphingomonas sp. TaxID=158754 RepID=UPI0025CBCC4E|nr:hypothetical protein [uncultured Sphingomonas sp.]